MSESRESLISAAREKQKPSQLTILQKFVNNHATEFPNVIQFVLILLASPGNTSCLERGYTFLEMICAKRRSKMKSEHIETFILKALNLPVGDVLEDHKCYSKATELLKKLMTLIPYTENVCENVYLRKISCLFIDKFLENLG